jgi:iron complex outermembrane receptor protein
VDRTERDDSGERRTTLDAELVRGFAPAGRHHVLAGAGYRVSYDEIRASAVTSLDPASRTLQLLSAFVQDEIQLPGRWRALVGTKLEHNDFTGFELQPTLRLAWSDGVRHTAWSAVSRAVRTPSRAARDLRHVAAIFPVSDGSLRQLVLTGSDATSSETLTALEAGYRFRKGEGFSIDVATFLNDYAHLTTLEPGAPFSRPGQPPTVVLPRVPSNRAEALAWGVETAATWRPASAWQLVLGYSHLSLEVEARDSLDPQATAREGFAPRHQLDLHSRLDLPRGFELDASLYFVDRLPARAVPAYARLDAMLGWRPRPGLELRAGVQDALHSNHAESSGPISGLADTRVPRSLWIRASWGF